MAIAITHRIEGLDDLQGNINRIAKEFRDDAVRDGLKEAAKPVLDKARADVPVASGELRDSLEIEKPTITGPGKGFIRVKASHRKGGYHAHLIEFGTSRQRAQPYLRPAQSETTGKQRDAFIDTINSANKRSIR